MVPAPLAVAVAGAAAAEEEAVAYGRRHGLNDLEGKVRELLED